VLSRLGIEASPAIQYLIAFVIILGLVTLFGLVLRRVTSARLMLPGQDRGRSRQPRLGVVDIYDLDRQRQLILLRRDNVEHLLLIGGPNDVVIETNIVRVSPARVPAPSADAERSDELAPPMRPTVEPPARPALEPVAARLGPALGRTEESDAAQELSPVAMIPPVPTPARSEPMLKPNAVTLAPAAAEPPVAAPPPRPAGPAAQPEPPVDRPAAVPVRPRAAEPPARPAAQAPAPMPTAPVLPGSPREPRVPDAAILNDMARQLEEALRRPNSAVAPAPTPPAGPAPVPPAPEPRREAPANPPLRTTVTPEPSRPAMPPRPAAANEPPRPAALAAPATNAPAAAAPAAAPQPANPEAPPAQAAEGPQRNPDPFSVDDIEAEFARLLGRPADKN
jgi:hypothetical protein